MGEQICVHESVVAAEQHADRWSKDLVGGAEVPTKGGFNIGIAEYHVAEFGAAQVHDDQEALYVLAGVGQVRVGDRVVDVEPGSKVYVPPGTRHATRRTGKEPVRVLYTHAKVVAGGETCDKDLGVSTHDGPEFNPPRVHDDQEALYVVSGAGQILVGEEVLDVRPGHAVYVGAGVRHATRRTGREAIRTVFAHGAE